MIMCRMFSSVFVLYAYIHRHTHKYMFYNKKAACAMNYRDSSPEMLSSYFVPLCQSKSEDFFWFC